jgi:phosphohistidine phosphatase SixA
MKYLFLVRHGSAEEFSPEGDFARNLTDTGLKQAKTAAELSISHKKKSCCF